MTDFVVIVVIAAIVGIAVAYIIKEKKRGIKCIGCPAAATCANRGKCKGAEGGANHTCDSSTCKGNENRAD